MSGRFFLDTNLFVHAFDPPGTSKETTAADLIRRAANTGEGIISYQVVQEFFSVAFRRFSQPMSAAEAEQYLITVLRPLLAVHSSPAMYFQALRIRENNRISWYDSLIVAAAIEGRCEKLYSEDFQHGRKIEGIQIENPFV
jgi:predicted nucleic acid-binding protein